MSRMGKNMKIGWVMACNEAVFDPIMIKQQLVTVSQPYFGAFFVINNLCSIARKVISGTISGGVEQ